MNKRIFFTSFILISTLSVSGCGSSTVSKEFESAISACSGVAVLDTFLQEKNTEVDYVDIISRIVQDAEAAANENLEKYGQLAVLAGNMQNALQNGDERGIMQIIAVEGECSNLGMWAN